MLLVVIGSARLVEIDAERLNDRSRRGEMGTAADLKWP